MAINNDNKKKISPMLKVRTEFSRLCYPLPEVEVNTLKDNIANTSDPIAINTWNSTILYEFELYEICSAQNKPVSAVKQYFKSYEDALRFVCMKQLERSDLSSVMRKYLIGKRFSYEKTLSAHESAAIKAALSGSTPDKAAPVRHYGSILQIKERIAEDYHICMGTIEKYLRLANAIDILYDYKREIALSILQGKLKIPKDLLIKMPKMSTADIMAIIDSAYEKASTTYKSSVPKKKIQQKSEDTHNLLPKIKDIPEYDPDAEISSLILTIPSWISTIERVRKNICIDKISENAKQKIETELNRLDYKILELFDTVKE